MKGRRKTAPPRKPEAELELPVSVDPANSGPAEKAHWTSLAAGLAILMAGAWAYWPTLSEMVHAWEVEPDYSHGYLVVPMAGLFLWFKRSGFPGLRPGAWMLGLGLVLASCAVRLLA